MRFTIVYLGKNIRNIQNKKDTHNIEKSMNADLQYIA